ncbi:MAG: glycyl-radical enzyme activating protein, partial [Holdemanella sp.]|nr:glycyl-radical enzyme activating protein [Holdemanella sp.]
MNQPKIFNIQRFSTHDGDGVRTSIFFKGCPLHCLWCHNPESQKYESELIFYKHKCVQCKRCTTVCSCNEMIKGKILYHREKCFQCGICIDHCFYDARELAGKEYSLLELYKEIKKDFIFFENSHGGITLSGGEVMAQDMDYIEKLCKKLYKDGISIYIDTCAYAPYEHFQ